MIGSYILMGIYIVCLLLLTPIVPFSLGVGGILAFLWFRQSKTVYAVAFLAGLLIDLNYGRPLGSGSLALVLTAGLGAIIHEHFPQWWMLLLMTILAGIIWSLWFWDHIVPGAILGCVFSAGWWYGVNWYFLGKHRGVYLKR